MNRNSSIVVLSLLAAIGFGLIASPITVSASSSGDFLDIRKAKIGVKTYEDVIKKLFIETRDDIPTDGSAGAFGYGLVLNNGKAIVTTTHAGVLDSEDQQGILDPIWHNHFVELDSANQACLDEGLSGVAVVDITFESPGKVIIDENTASLKNLPRSAPSLFNMNNDITPGADLVDKIVASFILQPLLDLTEENPLVAVCIDDIQPVDDRYVKIFEIKYKQYYEEERYDYEEEYEYEENNDYYYGNDYYYKNRR